jgi:hypothetical protein
MNPNMPIHISQLVTRLFKRGDALAVGADRRVC